MLNDFEVHRKHLSAVYLSNHELQGRTVEHALQEISTKLVSTPIREIIGIS